MEQAFWPLDESANVVGELESVSLMAQAVRARLGATVLPLSVARRIVGADDLSVRRIDPAITVRVSLGTQGNHTPSRPAERVRGLLRAIVRQLGAQEPGESDAQLGTPPVGQ